MACCGVASPRRSASTTASSSRLASGSNLGLQIFPLLTRNSVVDLDAENERAVKTHDVSAKGIGVISKDYLKVGNHLRVWINVNDGREPFYTEGWVMWSTRQDTGGYKSGILLEKAELMGMSRIFRP